MHPPANFEEMLTRLNSLREVLDLRINATFTESFVQIGLFVSKIYLDELFCTHARAAVIFLFSPSRTRRLCLTQLRILSGISILLFVYELWGTRNKVRTTVF